MENTSRHDALNQSVDQYNSDTYEALTKSLRYGSLTRSRSTLAELAGLAANDNNQVKGE